MGAKALPDKLTFVVQSVRTLLEDPLISSPYIGFTRFPKGACADASCLLGLILADMGLGSWDVVIGTNNMRTHGWLVEDTTFIDITADQFDNSLKCWVSRGRLLSEPYLGFKINDRYTVQDYSRRIVDLSFYAVLGTIRKDLLANNERQI